MPLSEQEQRLLEEMERNLYQNDADFIPTVSTRRGKTNYTLIVVGILIAILGVGVIVTGVIMSLPLLGVAGFIVMFGGVLLAIAPPRTSGPPQEPSAAERASARAPGGGGPGLGSARSGPSQSGPSRSGFMDRMNDRWDKRQDDSGDR